MDARLRLRNPMVHASLAGFDLRIEVVRCQEHEIKVGGRMEQGYGTACRQPDGSWEIQ